MSAREQAKRDAEFDRLLGNLRICGGCGNDNEQDLRDAYEMGKRHGRDEDDAEYDVVICDSLRCRDGSRMPGFGPCPICHGHGVHKRKREVRM